MLVEGKLAPGTRKLELTTHTDAVIGSVVAAEESRATVLLFHNQLSSARWVHRCPLALPAFAYEFIDHSSALRAVVLGHEGDDS